MKTQDKENRKGASGKIRKPFDLMCVSIDDLRVGFGIHNGLAGVKATVAGEDKANYAHNGEDDQIVIAEHFHTENDGSGGAVGYAAEQRDHAQCGTKSGIQAEHLRHDTAEGGTDEESGDDFAAFVTGT